MVSAEAELVTFKSSGLTASLTAEAEANAEAKFTLRRGVRATVEARAQIKGEIEAKLDNDPNGKAAAATVRASLGLGARGAFAAQLDVNGLWAEAAVAAEARAQIRGNIKVSGQQLFDALGLDSALDPLPAGALVPAMALLKEAAVDAAVFAEAYFGVRARVQLMAAGSVIPRSDGQPSGIVVAYECGYAYLWGAGTSGRVTVELPDPARAVTVVADAVVDEAVRLLPVGTPTLIVSLLNMVVPLAASAAVAAGNALGAPQAEDPGVGPGGGAAVTDTVLSELSGHGLTLALNAVLDAGLDALANMVNRSLELIGITDAVRTAGQAALDEVQTALDAFEAAKSLADALPHIVGVFDRLAVFAEAAAAEVDGFDDVATGLTVTAAAAGILQQVLGGDPITDFPAAAAQRVLGQQPGPLTVDALVGYLAANLATLGERPLASVHWLADVVGCQPSELVTALYHLGKDLLDPAARRRLATDLVHGITEQLTQHLHPFINQLPPDSELKDLAAFIGPLLDVVEHALVPALSATTATEAARARDELDTLLTGMFGAVVVRCLDVILRPFFQQGQQQLRNLADRVNRGGPEFAAFFEAANSAEVVFRISPVIVVESLRQMAGILKVAETTAFESAVKLSRTFVLLPPDTQERRVQLDELAGGDGTRLDDGALYKDLLEAMFVDSTKFALGLIPPSAVMTSLIAIEQGPVPLFTVYVESRQVLESTVAAIGTLATLGGTVVDVLAAIRSRKLDPEDLRALGTALRTFIGASAELVHDVLAVVRTVSLPVFVLVTGGIGLFNKVKEATFDKFFDAADALVEDIRQALSDVTDGLIEAMIAAAQDVGLFDTGKDEDLGTLGEAVRQRSLGAPGQPDLLLVDGNVPLSRAELATMATNAAFANKDVRDRVRAFHQRAVAQAEVARESAAVLQADAELADTAKRELETRLKAQQRDDGFVFGVSIEGIERGSATGSNHRFQVVITGAGPEFIDGFHQLVRVEVGGWPVKIDRDSWQVEAVGTLRGFFEVMSDPSVGTAHPFVGEGFVPIPPQQAVDGPDDDDALRALHAVVREYSPLTSGTDDPAAFLARPAVRGGPATTLTAEMFVAPVLTGGPVGSQRFPGVLSFDRQPFIAAAFNAKTADTLQHLPGTDERAFVSTADQETLNLLNGLTTSVTAAQPVLDMVARARPGYTTVTATVRAAPKPGQDMNTAPAGQADPTWFVLAGADPGPAPGPTPPPPLTNIAVFVREIGTVPAGLVQGESTTVQIVMLNAGTATWTSAAGYKLSRVQQQLPDAFVELPHDVLPQQEVTFTIPIDAPPAGGLIFQWQMTQITPGRQAPFEGGATPEHDVALQFDIATGGPQVVPLTIPRDMTANVSVTMINSGTSTWTPGAGYRLTATGYGFGAPVHELTTTVPPKGSVKFEFTIGPPPQPSAFEWQMTHHNVAFLTRSQLVTVRATEPSTCAGLRGDLAELEKELVDLQADLHDPRTPDKSDITRMINELKPKITDKKSQIKAQGCNP